jgi:hypothetical protein
MLLPSEKPNRGVSDKLHVPNILSAVKADIYEVDVRCTSFPYAPELYMNLQLVIDGGLLVLIYIAPP